MRSIPIPPTTTTNTLAPTSSTVVVVTTITTMTNKTSVPSAWHSPVPYLFGGLAAIMALIALALLMLACSYWRLTQESNNNNNNNVVKEGDDDSEKKEQPKVYEEKILVIMAGDHNPTFLATPSSSFGCCSNFDHKKHLGNSEDSNNSYKETVDDHVVLNATHESGSARHDQHSENL
ncbi:Protein GLUTAMINE DUMPER 4 [Glycine soja]